MAGSNSAQRLVDDLAESEARNRAVLEAAVDSIITIDENGLIQSVNPAVTKTFGYSAEELHGQNISMLMPEPYRSEHDTYLSRYLKTGVKRIIGIGREVPGIRKDGSTFPMELSVSEVHLLGPNTKRLFTGILRDVTDRVRDKQLLVEAHQQLEQKVQERTAELRRANDLLREEIEERVRTEEQLEDSLKEKEVLLKEIHHRVKNNLQLISSLLNLQARSGQALTTEQLVFEIQGRIQSIALLHEMLYQSDELIRVDFSKYTATLSQTILRYFGSGSRVALHADVGEIKLSLDSGIYCGLLLNELLTNALKHAFPGSRKGNIYITGQRSDSTHIVLTVRDDGVGLKEGFDISACTTLGLELVQQLVKKLHGKLTISRTNGLAFEVVFEDREQ